MKLISFALTTAQFLDGSKTVTRRDGWRTLKAGDRLQAVDKVMGFKKGEHPARLGVIEIVSVRRERLDAIGREDCFAEGFPELEPWEFVAFFCKSMKCQPDIELTRIEFRKVDQ